MTQPTTILKEEDHRHRTGSDEFRDHIATVDDKGKRVWLYPRQPVRGKHYRLRTILSYVQLVLMFAAPFVKINGYPAVMFNIIERKFSFMGLIFWPQDFFIFVLCMIAGFIAIILFTAVFGRVWCGWLCPQTVFMEMLFRRVEYWIEGDYLAHEERDKGPMTKDRLRRKILKLSIFYVIAFVIGNVFLAYIIGGDALITLITDDPKKHIGGLSVMILFSLIFFWMYAWFREQFCTLLCPYARLQSVLLDNDSIVVTYDDRRGEPRTKASRGCPSKSLGGDCVNCNLCVQVCPTGIDIRNGTPQLECINCANCIDACASVMSKLDRKTGLIRYTSRNAIDRNSKFHLKPRTAAYGIILLGLTCVIATLLVGRLPIETTLLRPPGQTYLTLPTGEIRNVLTVQVLNKQPIDRTISFKLLSPEGGVLTVPSGSLLAPGEQLAKTVLFLDFKRDLVQSGKTKVIIGIYDGDKEIEQVSASFVSP